MKEFKASIKINAPAEKVWSILTAVGAWPEWYPNCDGVRGTVALGKKLQVFNKLSPGRAFPVKVAELVPNKKMVWSGGMPLGLFKGERTYTLTSKNDGSTEFVMHEVFSGPMLALIGKSIPDMTQDFQQYVTGLKNRAEKK